MQESPKEEQPSQDEKEGSHLHREALVSCYATNLASEGAVSTFASPSKSSFGPYFTYKEEQFDVAFRTKYPG